MLLRTKCAGMSIHIPLDIGNWRGIKNLADTFDDIVPHVRLRKVEQQLVAAQKIGTAKAVMQRPVRMPTVQLRIRADGFRLEPEAELQPHRIQLFAESLQAVRELFGVYGVIADFFSSSVSFGNLKVSINAVKVSLSASM